MMYSYTWIHLMKLSIIYMVRKGKLHKHFDHDYFASDCNSSQMNILVSYNSDQLVKDRFESSKVEC